MQCHPSSILVDGQMGPMVFCVREKLHIIFSPDRTASVIQRRIPGRRIHQTFLIVAVAALAAAIGQVTLGGVVRVTGSGLGCPDWPLCHGRLIPPFELATLIEYSHRVSASALVVLILVASAMAWLFYRSNYLIVVSTVLGLTMVMLAAVLGGLTVLTELAWWVRLLHLGMAEAVVACMAIVVVLVMRGQRRPQSDQRASAEAGGFRLLVLATAAGTFALIVFGSYMVGYGAGHSCGTWPLCNGDALPEGAPYAIHMGHRYLAVAVGALIIATAWAAWSRRAENPGIGWTGLAMVLLFGAQVMVGAGTVWAGFSPEMNALHLSLATLVWMAVALVAALAIAPQGLQLGSVPAGTRQIAETRRLAT